MWCSEITTCPTDIPTRGNREGFGGSPRSHWQIKIKIKLLVWSGFSYLCQDKQSSDSSPCVKVGWRREQEQPSCKHSSMDNTTQQGSFVCLGLKLHQQIANPPWSTGTKSLEPEMKDSELQGVWGVQSNPCTDPPLWAPCELCSHKNHKWALDWMRAPGAKFLFLFYFLRIQLSETFWLAQALLSSKQMQFFTKKDNSQVEFPLLSFSIRREN